MLSRVRQPAILFIMIIFLPGQFSARRADRERSIQKYQYIGIRDFLPHGLDIRMYLRHLTAGIAMLLKPCDQCGLTGTTPTHNTDERRRPVDERTGTWRLHNLLSPPRAESPIDYHASSG